MNKKIKVILIMIFLTMVLGGGYYFLLSREDKAGNTIVDNTFGWKYPVAKFPLVGPTSNEIAYSDIRDPGGISQGLPVRLKIPAINVDSAIEDALITPDGRMDVPSGSVNVAWFALGPHPGRVGSAVIGGHFGIRNGVKFVFYDLDKLVVGDKIYIENDKGDTLAFQVRRIQLFDRNADATDVFTSDDGLAHLNLITCEGIWNRVNDTYPKRRVVFTDAISREAVAPIAPTSGKGITQVTFYRTLRIGARGTDVVALQNALKQVGISLGVADGSFGPLTRNAVATYQRSAGLSPDGVFGPFSRAKLIAELSGDTGLPNVGTKESVSSTDAENRAPSSNTFTQFIKILFGTPTDGLITTFLLIAIIFAAYKLVISRY